MLLVELEMYNLLCSQIYQKQEPENETDLYSPAQGRSRSRKIRVQSQPRNIFFKYNLIISITFEICIRVPLLLQYTIK